MFKKKTKCRCCGGFDLKQFLDLGEQPLANSYHDGTAELPTYPLGVNFCPNCFHTQLTGVVDPDELFKNYLYVSGTSKTLQEYFKWFAEWSVGVVSGDMKQGLPEDYANLHILDIACNDGSQLDAFHALGLKNTFGVDPALNLVPIAQAKGHTVTPDYWTPAVARGLPAMDVIIAQNVFAHTDDIHEFLLACMEVMHDYSVLFIQTSQANMYTRNEFDTVYHEHLSFFNTNSMMVACHRAGLHLERVEKSTIHGTSYIFMITLTGNMLGRNVTEHRLKEEAAGLYDFKTYEKFAKNAETVLSELRCAVATARLMGKRVIGYGAAAKGMTVLNAAKIKLDFIVDDNPLKQGLLTPGMNIPIHGKDYIRANAVGMPVYGEVFIPLAWNFFDEIRKNIKEVRPDNLDKFIKYFPQLDIAT